MRGAYFSNFGSLKSTETAGFSDAVRNAGHFSNFGSLKSTETSYGIHHCQRRTLEFQQFRLVEEH